MVAAGVKGFGFGCESKSRHHKKAKAAVSTAVAAEIVLRILYVNHGNGGQLKQEKDVFSYGYNNSNHNSRDGTKSTVMLYGTQLSRI